MDMTVTKVRIAGMKRTAQALDQRLALRHILGVANALVGKGDL